MSATTPFTALDPYPETGMYWAKPDETCQKVRLCQLPLLHCAASDVARGQIAKTFGVDLQQLVQINKARYPTLLSNSKLKKDTTIVLPPPEMRWILTMRTAKVKPEGKKKSVYTVQVRVPATV